MVEGLPGMCEALGPGGPEQTRVQFALSHVIGMLCVGQRMFVLSALFSDA